MSRIAWSLPSRRIRSEDVWDAHGDLRDRTDELLDIMLPPLEEGDIRFSSSIIIGRPGSGKTTAANTIAEMAKHRFGKSINVVANYDLDDAMARFNGLPYQLLVVDDPIGATSSRQSMKNSDLMARYYRIRHIYRQMSGNDTGCIALVWATQHLKGLDVFARDIDWTVWKAWPTEEAAAKMLKDNLPPSAVRRLRDITRRALAQRDNETRSEAVVHLTVTNRVGTVKLPMSEGWHLPFPEDREPVADAEEFSLTITKVLRALGKDPKWKGKVAIYSDVMQGMTQMEAAKKTQSPFPVLGGGGHNIPPGRDVPQAWCGVRGLPGETTQGAVPPLRCHPLRRIAPTRCDHGGSADGGAEGVFSEVLGLHPHGVHRGIRPSSGAQGGP